MLWTLVLSLLKGIGKSALTTSKAIGLAGKELGKGMVGMQSQSSPLALGKAGSSAGAIAQAGKVANQIGGFVGKMTGTSSLQTPSTESKTNTGQSIIDKGLNLVSTLGKMSGQGRNASGPSTDQNPMQQTPMQEENTVAPMTQPSQPLAYSSPEGQLEEEILRRRQYGIS
jgi:hypothetical protein